MRRVVLCSPVPTRRRGGGWRQPDANPSLACLYEIDADPSTSDALIVQALMAVGSAQERLEFLG